MLQHEIYLIRMMCQRFVHNISLIMFLHCCHTTVICSFEHAKCFTPVSDSRLVRASALPVTLPFSWHNIFQDRKCIQCTIIIIANSFLAHIFTDMTCVIWLSGFTHVLIHTNFTRHAPSSPTHYSLSLHHPNISKVTISTAFTKFLSLLWSFSSKE